MIKEAVEIYNNERTHWSLNLKTPQEAHDEFNKHIYKSYSKKLHNVVVDKYGNKMWQNSSENELIIFPYFIPTQQNKS